MTEGEGKCKRGIAACAINRCMSDLYDTDIYAWAMRQAEALRRRSGNELDWDNLAEEIESVGKSELRELRSRYVVLLAHLLKWMAQPERRGSSWRITIATQRRLISEHLDETPSLKAKRDETFAKAYFEAVSLAALETGMEREVFPATNPFTLGQAMGDGFWPEGEPPL
jgi:Domain of unknown function DUF29